MSFSFRFVAVSLLSTPPHGAVHVVRFFPSVVHMISTIYKSKGYKLLCLLLPEQTEKQRERGGGEGR